jgi:CobQ-like glutamine amidotransferase family enzyme
VTALRIATLFPLATVAAGDEANAAALVRRAGARGLTATTATVHRPAAMVPAEVYLLGGTGRSGIGALVAALRAVDLPARVAAGAVALAVDAGLDALARSWVDPAGREQAGLGLLGVQVGPGPRITDTVATQATDELPAMVGWVAHDVTTRRDPGVAALCPVERGQAHGHLEDDGVLADRIIATRLHGPVLALNPELADLVLARVVPGLPPAPVPHAAARARGQRLDEVRTAPQPRHRRR